MIYHLDRMPHGGLLEAPQQLERLTPQATQRMGNTKASVSDNHSFSLSSMLSLN
jgi:hypothetical protein